MGFFSIRVSSKKPTAEQLEKLAASKGKLRKPTGWVRRETYDGKPYYFNHSAMSVDESVQFEKPDSLKTEEELARTSGEWVWAPHPTRIWQPAKVLKRNKDGSVLVQPYKGNQMTIPADGLMQPCRETGNRVQEVPLWPVNHTALDFLEDDVIQLDPVNEATILHNTEARYARDQIYTWVGAGRAVLLSLNPYKEIEGFDEANMSFHKSQENKPDKWIPPHVFAIANEAYDALIENKKDQSILISGDSGAGKTESTRHCLEFFAKQVGSEAVDHRVSEKLLYASPLLEAFGNAVTIRNFNSSRFGRWVEVTFSHESGQITGAKFTNFLLEKTRVIGHQERERSFHIFYQILQDADLVAELGLEKPKAYSYLNHSKASTGGPLAGIDDAAKFETVREALESLEFSGDEQSSIFRILSGVLNLGNIAFKDVDDATSQVTGSEVTSAGESWLAKAADALSLDGEALRAMLTSRTLSTRGEEIKVSLDAAAAKDATNALAKDVYNRLFSFLVKSVNEAMAPPAESFKIGILDIFGFEILEKNSFEQLLINYCNEKLQQYFNAHTFDVEESFYRAEGVDYSFLKYVDNQEVLDLLEIKSKGILHMLDDEGALGAGSDQSWLGKVEKEYGDHPCFETDFRRKFESVLSFEIKHYADTVKYDASGFVSKNKDTLWADLYSGASASSDAVMTKMYPARTTRSSNTKPVAAQFRGHVNNLLKLIQSTEVRFIRCIKPNERMESGSFEATLVAQQLRYSGVFETIEIRQGGYPFRLTHKQFAFRYACINIGLKYPKFDGHSAWRNLCAEILNNFYDETVAQNAQLGNSMVLYRVEVHKPLEVARNLAIEVNLPRIQGFIRGAIGRHYANQLREAEDTLQAALDAGNDIALVRKGFSLVEDTKAWLEPNLSFLPAYPMQLYNKGRHLESRLVAFEELEAEMHEASDNKVAEKVDVALYKHLIELCERADGDLADVVRTNAQQDLYEFCQELIHDSPPGLLDAEAGPALESLDRERMQAVSDKADEIGYPTEIVKRIKYILGRLEYLDVELVESLDVLDSVRMKEALDECRLYKHENADVHEIERLFDLPEIEFVQMELKAAKRLGDKPRELHRRIRLRELQILARHDELSNWAASGHVREATHYAKSAGMCGRTAVLLSMLRWTEKPIPCPLTLMPGEVPGVVDDTKEVKKMKKMCKANFVNVMKAMGDKKASQPDKFVQKVIDFGLANPGLRNEVFVQIIKQLTENPNEYSVEAGYELLSLCAAAFLPSDGFADYLTVWVMDHPPPDGNWHAITSGMHQLQFREEDEASESGAPSGDLAELRSELNKLREEGSRFSIAIDAFTGPTEAMRTKELSKLKAAKLNAAMDRPSL
ncbi:Myosin-1 [Hondaea fermentalgiana]|uniref:Myosin-1 n=1 Tax=Hondaea fermentalgiana TaxID=2315210 RepID=A0A2R5GIX6_9STRA|nr:Myosin-1 [Hondaea fermentalgiana]|eukprot:GBG29678.1 Myosin-1 [Hondaea fermentalgiana]